MFNLQKLLLGAVLLTSLGSTSAWGSTVYYFTGQCSDCTGSGVAVLTVDNYTPGDFLSVANFVSFSYTSNLFPSVVFQLGDPGLDLQGVIPASLPDFADVTITDLEPTLTNDQFTTD